MTPSTHQHDELCNHEEELTDLVEEVHPFFVMVDIIMAHMSDQSEKHEQLLTEEMITLAANTVQQMITPEALAEVQKDIPAMLAEQPELDETDLWISFIHMDPSIMPDLLQTMFNHIPRLIANKDITNEQQIYTQLEHYIATYKKTYEEQYHEEQE